MEDLPVELLIETFRYLEEDKKLYPCILVNKKWHNINIPTLWRNPFYSENSTKILINCLLAEDKDLLVEKKFTLRFELLAKPPLYNYARFATELDLRQFRKCLVTIVSPYYCLVGRLTDFILDHSIIREFKIYYSNYPRIFNPRILDHHRFDTCFQNIVELHCDINSNNSDLLDHLAITCRNIQVLRIDCSVSNDIVDSNLAHLISTQNQIKALLVYNLYNFPTNFSDVLKNAISIHSNSIINYESHGCDNLCSLISTFQNLKSLLLSSHPFQGKLNVLKNISHLNLEALNVEIIEQYFLLDLKAFIALNGNSLKYLTISGIPEDKSNLGELTKSIGRQCINLEYLSICYRNKEISQLIEIFNNCFKLKHISFSNIYSDYTLNGIKMLMVLNKSLSKNLNILKFEDQVNIIRNESLNQLMRNWRGPKPFKILKFYNGSYDEIVF